MVIKTKKINSIGYGGKILSFALAFILVIPGIIKLLMFNYKSVILVICAKVSLGIGAIIILIFMVLLAIEFYQDKKLNLYYKAHKNIKLTLGKGRYECQSCGNRIIKAEDKNCCICGIWFNDMGELNEENR